MGNVTVLDRGGQAYDVAEEQLPEYLRQGFRVENVSERAQRNLETVQEEQFGGTSGAVAAGALGALGTVTAGGSDALLAAAGGGDVLRQLRERHPIASTLGTVAGALTPIGLGGLAGDAGATVAGELGGGVLARAAGGATEGAIFGAGQGVSDLATSQDPLTWERAASTLGSNMLFGGAVGGLAGAGSALVERGLKRAGTALDEHIAARAVQDAVPDDLAALDAKGLRAARATEVDRLAEEQAAQRVTARSAAVDDVLAYRQVVQDANPWAAITEGEDAARLGKATKALRNALDDVKGLRDSPGSLLKPLRTEEQALEGAIANRAEIAKKLEAVNARIAEGLEKELGPKASVPTALNDQEFAAFAQNARIPADSAAALNSYSQNGLYGAINSNLREFAANPRLVSKFGDPLTRLPPELADTVRALDRGIAESAAPRDLVVYRGVNGDASARAGKVDLAALKPGESFIDHGYSSTSTDLGGVGKSYTQGLGVRPGVELHIEVPAGHPIAPVPSEFSAEKELLLPRGSKYTVTSVEKAADGHTILRVRVGDVPAAAPKTGDITLTGKAARRYATFADVKVPKGGTVTVAREDAQVFLDALKNGEVSGVGQQALGKLDGLLEQNRALQTKIKAAAAPLVPKAELASARLAAIDNARDALMVPKTESAGTKLLGHAAYSTAAGVVGSIPVIGHLLAPVVGAKAADLATRLVSGKLAEAVGTQAKRAGQAAKTFLDVAGKAAPAAPVLATRVLSQLRYAPERKGEPQPTTLPALFKQRTDEIKQLTAYDATGTPRIRPEARQALANQLRAIGIADPILADRLESLAVRRIEYLSSIIPRRPDIAGVPTGPDRWQPSSMAMRSWARSAAAVEDPHAVLERAIHGQVTPEDVAALRAVSPEMLASFAGEVSAQLSSLRATLPYKRRFALSILTGEPVDPALDPRVLAVLQGQFAAEPGTQGGTAAPRARPQFGSVRSLDKPTPAQARAQGAHV